MICFGTLFHVTKMLRKLVVVFLCLLLCQLNKPERHVHKVGNLNSVKILMLTSTITSEMENSWINKSCYGNLKQIVAELINCAVKYTDYLREKNRKEQQHAMSSFC